MKRLFTRTLWCLALAGCLLYGLRLWNQAGHTKMAAQFASQKVRRGDIQITVQATGTVQPENRLILKPPVNGRIDQVHVREGDLVHKGQNIATMSSTDRAALLDAARAKGTAEVAYWEELYRPTAIIAPMAGLIIARNVEAGQTISTQDNVFVMSNHLLVNVQVDETDLARVHLGQAAEITLDAYSGQIIPGKVTKIAFEARTVSNVTMYDIQVMPESVPDHMRSGMTASVKFKVDERRSVLTLPMSAIQHADGLKAQVLVDRKGGRGQRSDMMQLSARSLPDDHQARRDRKGPPPPPFGEPSDMASRGAGDRDFAPSGFGDAFIQSVAKLLAFTPPPPDHEPETVWVELGLSDGKTVEIISGLHEEQDVLEEKLVLPEAKSSNSFFSPPGGGRGGRSSGGRPGPGGPR